MDAGAILQAKLLNHGESEIWIETDGKTTEPRTLPTNEVVNVTRRLCPPEVFDAFYKEWHLTIGQIASLYTVNLDEIATELKLMM